MRVTPIFVEMAINKSNKLGWQPQPDYGRFCVQYEKGKFFLKFWKISEKLSNLIRPPLSPSKKGKPIENCYEKAFIYL